MLNWKLLKKLGLGGPCSNSLLQLDKTYACVDVLCHFQEYVDLDEWLGASKTDPEGGLLSQKLLKKLGLEGAGSNGLNTRTSADDTADDDQTASDFGELLKSVFNWQEQWACAELLLAASHLLPNVHKCIELCKCRASPRW